MGFTVNDSLDTIYGISIIGAYFNISQNDIYISEKSKMVSFSLKLPSKCITRTQID